MTANASTIAFSQTERNVKGKKKKKDRVCVCDAAVAAATAAAVATRSIRKQEAALMLGNGDDFHLGDADAVIVAVLSVLLVMLMTDGFFVSIQIYFHRCQRGKNTQSTLLPSTNSLK